LMARLDRLGAAKEIAQIGAAIGREFSHALLGAVAGNPEVGLAGALDRLLAAGLLFREGVPPNATYLFKHALVRDAAYSTLLRSRRQQLHARITAALEGQFPGIVETHPDVVARHCAEAGLVEKAVRYWLQAGQQAIARGAMTEAVAQLRKGLDLLSGAPDGTARWEQELDLQISLGRALIATKGYAAPESGEVYARARQLCERLNRPAQLGPVLVGQFVFRIVRGELKQAEHHAEEMRQLGEARNDVMWTCFGSLYSGIICSWLGKFVEARTYCENALSLWDPKYREFVAFELDVTFPGIQLSDWYREARRAVDQDKRSPQDPHMQLLMTLSRTLLCLGYVDQARLLRDQALAEARRGSPFILVVALSLAWLGDWAIEGVRSAPAMLRSADEVLAISAKLAFWLGTGPIMRGWCLGAVGRAAEGIPLLVQGLAVRRSTGAKLVVPFYLTTLAEVCGMAAQPQQGLDRLAEAAELVETTQEHWAEAEIHRVQGTLLLSMRDSIAAEDSYRRALAVAQQQSAKFWELRAAVDLARLWLNQGKRTEARDLLAPIYEWFTEGFDTPVLKEAKALLEQLTA